MPARAFIKSVFGKSQRQTMGIPLFIAVPDSHTSPSDISNTSYFIKQACLWDLGVCDGVRSPFFRCASRVATKFAIKGNH